MLGRELAADGIVRCLWQRFSAISALLQVLFLVLIFPPLESSKRGCRSRRLARSGAQFCRCSCRFEISTTANRFKDRICDHDWIFCLPHVFTPPPRNSDNSIA